MIAEKCKTLAKVAHGKVLRGKGDTVIRGHFTDTRSPVPGGLFIALRGENFDGHAFVHDAFTKHGAAAVMVERESAIDDLPSEANAILVDDARQAYLDLAAAHRQNLKNCMWIGVTGSVGKSTTKEMIAAILASASPPRKIQKAQGSFNNEIGLSRTILETDSEHDCAVLELGTNHPGEISRLAQSACPQIAVITCAAESHLEAFGSVENIAREKGSILDAQSSSDTAILNIDDTYFEHWQSRARGSVLSFGLSAQADVQGWDLRFNENGCARFNVYCAPMNSTATCTLSIPGAHLPMNALAAIAATLATGVPLDEACAALAQFKGLTRRFALHDLNGVTLIDDAYNASPKSFRAALETLNTMPASRRIVVAGGMLELGKTSAEQHRALGKTLASSKLQELHVVGDLGREIGVAALESGLNSIRVAFHSTPEEAAKALKNDMNSGDVILIKGSHGIQLDRCVKALLSSR